MGDVEGLVEKIKDVVPTQEDQVRTPRSRSRLTRASQTKLMDKIYQGNFSLRDMYEQFENILKMGPLNKVMEMIPGFSNLLKQTGGANVRPCVVV